LVGGSGGASDRPGRGGGPVWLYDGGAGDMGWMSKEARAFVGGAGDVGLRADRAGVARTGAAPDKDDSAGRRVWMLSKTSSSMTPFSRRFSSSYSSLQYVTIRR
jgi:hypothetical protein